MKFFHFVIFTKLVKVPERGVKLVRKKILTIYKFLKNPISVSEGINWNKDPSKVLVHLNMDN